MRKFIKNITLFILPIIIFCLITILPCVYVLRETGEFKTLESNVKKQRDTENVLIGCLYSEDNKFIKRLNANYYEAQIISLGSSRVMQFKSEYINDFYNCGWGANGNYDSYINFVQNLDYNPNVMLVGLDLWVFNDAWNEEQIKYPTYQEIKKIDRDKKAIIKESILDCVTRRWNFTDLKKYSNNIGINARVNNNGLAKDGSYYYGKIYRTPDYREKFFLNILKDIDQGTNRFVYGEDVDEETLMLLEKFIVFCQEKEIEPIMFLTPLPPRIYDAMEENGNYGYVEKISSACKRICDKYNVEYYDYLNWEPSTFTDEFYIDGLHGSEVLYGHITKDMIEKGSIIKKYVSEDKLNRLLENPYSGLCFHKPE